MLWRQYLYINLKSTLFRLPRMQLINKKWVMFQLIYGVAQLHFKGISHGDLKPENILLTSWDWLYIVYAFKLATLPITSLHTYKRKM